MYVLLYIQDMLTAFQTQRSLFSDIPNTTTFILRERVDKVLVLALIDPLIL